MRLMVMGSGRHGKGTFCKLAAAFFDLSSVSSSQFACEMFLFDDLKSKMGYATLDDCFNDRHNHRQLWYERILAYNTPDLTRLGRGIFGYYDIYDGIRAIDEFDALKAAKAFDLAIWVDASERLPSEDLSSMTVHRGCADIIIENNGTEQEYNHKVVRLLSALTGKPVELL